MKNYADINPQEFTQKDLMLFLLTSTQHMVTREELQNVKKEILDRFEEQKTEINSVRNEVTSLQTEMNKKFDETINFAKEKFDESINLTKEKFEEYVKDNRIWFGKDGNSAPRIKRFLSEVKNTITPMTIWKYTEVEHSQEAKQKLKKLFDGKSFFDYPKPVTLIKRMLELYTNKNDIILDFFSGSATTAHAVMELNAEDGGERQFIMVQIPEKVDEKSEATKPDIKQSVILEEIE